MNVIELDNITKDFRQHFWTPKRRVLDGITFSVKSGEVFGFLGPNGSGKTTTIKILFEILFPTLGAARIFGRPVGDKESKRRIGFLPENPYFYDYLTAQQFLEFHGQLTGCSRSYIRKRIPEVLELTGMKGTNDIHLRNFSKGMLQRIGLAQAIIHDPDLVILDEPLTGLDPLGRKEVRDLMVRLRDEGKSVFFSTHILSDVELICDRVAILSKGKVLKCGALDELVSYDKKYVDMVWKSVGSELLSYIEKQSINLRHSADQIAFQISRQQDEDQASFEKRTHEILKKGVDSGAVICSFSPREATLEEVFVKEIGNMEYRV